MSRSLFILVLLGWILTDSVRAQAALSAAPAVIPGQWSLDISPGVSVPVQNWNPAYTFGIGSALRLGYGLNDHWKVSLGLDYYYFSGTNFAGNVSDNDLRILPRIAYYFGSGNFRVYEFTEAGTAFQFAAASLGAFTNFNFDFAQGLGVETNLDLRDAVFMEARYNMILASDVLGQDISLGLGYRMAL